MRVVMIDPGAFTPAYDDAFCTALAREGCDVELVTAPFVYHPWPDPSNYRRREVFAGGSGPAGEFGGAPLRAARRLRRALLYPLAWRTLCIELLRRPPHIVHLQWSLLPAVEKRALSRLRAAGVAVVQTVHNPRPHAGEGSLLRARPRLFSAADALVALSEATGRTLSADHPELSGKVRIIPPGLADFDPVDGVERIERVDRVDRVERNERIERAAARARVGIEDGAPVALFLGLIRPYKGLDLLLEAFAGVLREVPAARLVVAGLPRMSFRPFARQIERLGIGERVQTDLRYLPQTAMADYLTAADLVVLPYRDASQSAVLGAALARDRPVVVSAAGGLPEMLPETADAMLTPAGDVPALTRAMSRLLGARDIAEELGRRAGSAARQRFSWTRSAAASVRLYRELGSIERGENPA